MRGEKAKAQEPTAAPTLSSIFTRFLRFGLLAWGGPIAQIAMVKRELVEEQQWVTPSRFNRLLAIYQVLPGPEAHELCVHLGMVKRGRAGGIAAGLGFMLPGLILMILLSWFYRQLDLSQQPWAALFLGIQVGVIALIVRAVHRIGEHILTRPALWLIAALGMAGALAGVSFWVMLPAAGVGYALLAQGHRLGALAVLAAAIAAAALTLPGDAAPVADAQFAPGPASVAALFLSGLKAGLLTFGGAYTAIPFVRDDAVGRGWTSDSQFLDGLALSSVIPAPLIIFATFVGYQAGGLAGALAITAGIFLPAFGFALLFFERLERVMEDERWHSLLEGVAAGVVGLVAATAVQLALGLAGKVPSLPIAAAILAAMLALLYAWKSKLTVIAVVLLSGAAGWAAFS